MSYMYVDYLSHTCMTLKLLKKHVLWRENAVLLKYTRRGTFISHMYTYCLILFIIRHQLYL